VSTGAPATAQIDRERVRALTERERTQLDAATPESKRMFERARRSMPLGVPSSYHAREPWPIYIERGQGDVVWDVDGREMFDFHNGFGSMVQGHAHPAITRAVQERASLGTHFSAPTNDGILVTEELAHRFGLPKWRFTNSGSEATMDAIRIARGLTGRDSVLKIFGSYHGHHDTVMVSIGVDYHDIGFREAPPSLPYGAGIPQATVDLTFAVPFNDADLLEQRIAGLDAEGRKPACLIMEPVMLNIGVVPPHPGYLEAVRDITTRYEIVLIFDEVKTGLVIAPGGATDRFAVTPDMVTLAKALGGGLPAGAIGGTEQVMAVVEDGSVFQVGTYNGNPLVMAAARASLEQVLTRETYEHLERTGERILARCQEVVDRYRLPAYSVGIGAKGCVTFSPTRIVDYETYKENQDVELTELAWLYNLNRGIFMTPGREEEWTLSVAHDEEAIDAFVSAFDELARELTN
jgi:glutamate-1-semialdehyde 2,1-aminomutase